MFLAIKGVPGIALPREGPGPLGQLSPGPVLDSATTSWKALLALSSAFSQSEGRLNSYQSLAPQTCCTPTPATALPQASRLRTYSCAEGGPLAGAHSCPGGGGEGPGAAGGRVGLVPEAQGPEAEPQWLPEEIHQGQGLCATQTSGICISLV